MLLNAIFRFVLSIYGAVNKTLTLICFCWFIHSQDAHELFHVLTSSLEEERDRKPKVTHFFDMQSLEASYQYF